MSFLRNLFKVDYDTRAKELLDKIKVCETTLNSLVSQIDGALNNSNNGVMQKIPAIKKSYANLISQLKNIASTINFLKNRFGVNVARVPASNKLNNRQYVNVNKNRGKYVVRTIPPIIKMQSLLEKLRTLHAANKQLKNSQNKNAMNAKTAQNKNARNAKEKADKEAKSEQNRQMLAAEIARRNNDKKRAHNTLQTIRADLTTKSKTLKNLKNAVAINNAAVNKNMMVTNPLSQELQEFPLKKGNGTGP